MAAVPAAAAAGQRTKDLTETQLLARASPGGLGLATNPKFRLPPHLDKVDERITDFVCEVARKSEVEGIERHEGETRAGPRLMIFMPPRHGKSMLTSIYTPAWTLGSFPEMRVVSASYQGDLPTLWGRRSRELLTEYGPELYGVSVNPSSRAASEWETTAGGGFRGVGMKGGITGRGAELMIIDDPVKDQKAAFSETARKDAWDWWISTARPRLQPGGGVILIMTRWHEDDLAGRMLKAAEEGEGDQWEVLSYPALAERPRDAEGNPIGSKNKIVDDLGRREGDALWPQMYDREYLEATRRPSVFWFNAMYQQHPSPPEGTIIHREWLYEPMYQPLQPQFESLKMRVIESWDFTFKKGASSDSSFVCGQAWGADGADRWLLAQIRARLEFTDMIKALLAMEQFVETLGWQKPGGHTILVEEKANGAAVISTLRRRVQGLIPINPKESKEARLQAVTTQFEAGNVHIPEGSIPCPPAPKGEDGKPLWTPTPTEEYVEELVNFPLGAHDDMVDCTSQALDRYGEKKGKGQGNEIRSGGHGGKRKSSGSAKERAERATSRARVRRAASRRNR